MARNKKGRNISGVILLDKDSGLSSNAALQKVKRLFFAKKAGHTGSLDPLASGILPICLGQATKIAQFLLNDDKRYIVQAKLGEKTTTGDSEGDTIEIKHTDYLNIDKIITTSKSFQGEILQIPPMYSALKKNGQPLYKLARAGIEVERKPRKINIYNIKYLRYENTILSLEVSCSKGTYIRTLVEDIGNKLGCGAHIIKLRRTGFAHINIQESIKFSTLEKLTTSDYKKLDANIVKTQNLLPNMPSIYLDDTQSIDISLGREVQIQDTKENELIKLFNKKKYFLGIGEVDNNFLKPKRLFI